ncbi:putrescine transport system ATP-binding protein [Aliiroseovarius sediminilitoris]|uniref:Spermidine/putrescine import ATP-binding protein PotA n=1 Tax=Aliiroseovarius sediminilitoris TaxID=1173584 RepID=A0A1I0QCY1_9RHOB|nr:ABC transporter ATP-binding protein [Aliiroseovarius sediminilitoris]SEW24903.1 putrescine transport system ATP-binding protein [Aliiroseovarius sediminilitoris]
MSDAATAPVSVFAPWEDAQAKPLIQFQNVTKRWGDFTAIDDLSIDIYAQEFFALLGPSGCGKTTMMRMLAGFETPTEGAILIDGQNIAAIPPNKRAVNMMFQSYALFPHLSVAENIAFGLKRDKQPKDQIAARVEEMLTLVQLNKFANRKPHQISGGQRQRVALARSLAKAPKLLLLDEPLGALDKKLRQDTQFELMDIQEKTGTTFVIVTHDQEEAMTVASRIAVMDHGKIIQVDTPSKIYEEPKSIYVADFIGDVNLIRGNVSKTGGGHASIAWAEGQPELTGISQQDLPLGGAATLAVRPEKMSIYTSRPKDQANVIKGKVLDIAYLGNMSTYVIETTTGETIKAQIANTRRIHRRQITWEDKVWLGFTDTAGVVLDK